MSKSNKNNLSSSLSSKTAPSNRKPQSIWKRLERKVSHWLTKYAGSAKTFNFTFISFDGEFLKWLVWFLIALSIYILVCHHCGIPPLCILDKVIELIKTFVQ